MTSKRFFTAALAAASISAIAPGQAAAKTYRVDVLAQASWNGKSLAVSLNGKPIGSCRGSATLRSYGVLFRSRCKGGRVTVRVRYANGNAARGTWRLIDGTGRYRNASGVGRFSGNVSQMKYRMTGRVTY